MSNRKPGQPEPAKDPEEGLPPEAQRFLGEVIAGSLARYEVLHFFHQNPYAILTISDLAGWMSRQERPLAEALQQLAAARYLGQSVASAAFVLMPDRETRRKIGAFFDYLDEHPELARQIREHLRQPVEGE